MKKHLLSILLFFFLAHSGFSQNNFFTDISESKIVFDAGQRKIIPNRYRTVALDTLGIMQLLKNTPKEFTPEARNKKVILQIPMPDGSSQKFSIVKTEIMEPKLTSKFPEITAYGGQGIDDPTATIKIDMTPRGFHAMILSIHGSTFLDPYANGTLQHYISYYKKDLTPKDPFTEEIDGKDVSIAQRTEAFNGCIGDTLRRYRVAVACTGEYGVAVGATTIAQALSAIVTSVNRVNGVYETELAIRLVLVDSNYKIVFIDPATDPFTQNGNGSGLLTESIKVCDSLIGSPNYDIGHTFSTGAGGVAGLRVVCGASKARGVTGRTNPTGDPYDIDYVAHEMGHQFGGNHTFNSVTGSCNGNRSAAANAEPGSGTTIMAYAGICTINNLQPNSDPYFHPVSYNEITNFAINLGGNSCPVKILTGNTSPVAYAGLDYIIPRSTPFVLSGSGTDPDDDPLTFSWDQMDVGGPAGNWNAPMGNAPLFRFFNPTPQPTRYFPKLSDVINNTTTIGELLPSYGRTMNFRLTARDNRAGGGGLCWDQMLVTVNNAAGPFVVLAPNTADTFRVGTFMQLRWDVAKTDIAPVSCDSVLVELSLDGGLTFPIQLLDKTLNDGNEDIIVPNYPTSTARIRIRALKNVFYDISNVNFVIQANTVSEFIFNSPITVIDCPGENPSTLLLTNGVNNFTTPIALTASNVPAGVTVVFSGNPVTPGSSVNVTLQGKLAAGVYNVLITGTAGSVVRTRTIQFSIGTPTVAPALALPSNNASGQVLLPTLRWAPVVGATGYNLLLSLSSNFSDTVVSATNLTDTTFRVTTSLVQNTFYYWRVSALNTCGAGPSSSTYSFKTGIIVCGDTLYSPNVPVVIPVTAATVTSTLTIPQGGIIADVDVVGLKGTHTYVSDLTFTLRSPANTTVSLVSGVCGSQDNFDLNLDDEAASATITCPPTGGQVRRPLEALSKLDNENSTGTWTLSVNDAFNEDGGSLTGWGLRICLYTTAPLPVNWLSFTGKKAGNNVQLSWSTANEFKSDHYEIERSADGFNFAPIGTLDAGKHPDMVQQYYFNDLKPYSGVSYYRLKQIDQDGHFTYSVVVRITMGKGALLWSVYPNPAHDFTTVRMLADVSSLQIQLTDASGKQVYSKYEQTAKAGQLIKLPLNNLAKGVYMLSVKTSTDTKTEKIVVQ